MEEWRTIDFASNYEVSKEGLVRNKKTKYILKGRKSKNGYLQVSLTMNDTGKQKNQYIHRLVALSWLEQQPKKNQVNHKDGNKENNNVENLEWVDSHENLLHKTRVLKKNKTSNREVGMFTLEGELIRAFSSVQEAADSFDKSRVNIDSALKHKYGQKTAYGYVWEYLN